MPKTNVTPNPTELLTPADVEAEWQIPIATLYRWRHKRLGPKAIKIGRHLRYRRSDLEAFLAEATER